MPLRVKRPILRRTTGTKRALSDGRGKKRGLRRPVLYQRKTSLDKDLRRAVLRARAA